MISELETLVVRLTSEGAQYNQMMDAIESKTVAMVARLQVLGAKASVAITAPLVAAGTYGVKQYSNFNDAMTKSTAIMVGLTGELRDEMESTAKAISGQSITAPAKVAEAYYFLASAGLDAKAAIAAVATVEQFAVAGAFDMATATSLLADTQSALGLRSADAAENMMNMKRVADVLSKANIAANASSQQFAVALTTKSAAALRSLNKDIEEGVAILAAFADQGIKAENAGEKLAIVLRDLQTASINQREEWQRYGLKVYDSAGKMRPTVDIIEDLEKSLGKMSDRQRKKAMLDLGFSDMSVGALMSLLGTSSKIRDYEKALRGAAGATETIAKEQMKSFASQMAIVYNQATILAIEIGEVLAPYVGKLGTAASATIAWLRSLTPEVRTMAVFAGVAAAALGPTLIAVSRLGMFAVGTGRSLAGFAGMGLRFVLAPVGLMARGLLQVSYLGRSFGSSMRAGAAMAASGVSAATTTILSKSAAIGRQWGPVLVAQVKSSLAQVPGITRTALATSQGALQAFVRGWTGNLALMSSQTNLTFNRIGSSARYWLSRPADYIEAAFPGAIGRGMSKAHDIYNQQLLRMRVAGKAFYAGLIGADLPYRSRVGQTSQWVGQQMHRAWSWASQRVSDAYNAAATRVQSTTSRMAAKVVGWYEFIRSAAVAKWSAAASAGNSRITAMTSLLSTAFNRAWNMVPPQARAAFGRILPLVRTDGTRIGMALVAGVRFAMPLAAGAVVSGMQGAFSVVRIGAVATGRFMTRMGGGFVSMLGSLSSIASLLGSSGGALAGWASSLSMFAIALPAIGSVAAILVSWPGIIAMGVAAWATLTDTGRDFTQWLSKTFGPAFQNAKNTIMGIVGALKNGDFELAGKIAMTGLKATFYAGLQGLSADWGGFVQGVVETFLGGAQIVGEAWIRTVSGITQGILKAAQQEGVIGDIMAQVLGTDVRAMPEEQKANWISQNADAARNARKEMERYQKQVEDLQANGGSADAIAEAQKQVDHFDKLRRKFVEKAKNPDQAFLGNLDADLAAGVPNADEAVEAFRSRMAERMGNASSFLGNLGTKATEAEAELKALTDQLKAAEGGDAAKEMADDATSAIDDVTSSIEEARDSAEKPIAIKFSAEGINSVEAHTAEAMARLEAYRSTAQKQIPLAADRANVDAGVGAIVGGFGMALDPMAGMPRLPEAPEPAPLVDTNYGLGPELSAEDMQVTEPAFADEGNTEEITQLLQELVANTAPTRQSNAAVLIPLGSLRTENA